MTTLTTRLTAAKTIAVEQTTPGPLAPGHVRLRLAAASLCGTDLHYYKDFANAGFVLRNPVTLGHEGCGTVTDPGDSGLAVGQLVALNPIMNCGICPACARGEVNLCTAKKFPGSATTVPHLDGFFREVIDHPAAQCRPVANGVDPRHLTFAEPLACALHSLNKAGVTKGDKVLVTGCGPMGLLAIAGAAARGAEVTCLDLREQATEVGLRAGAAHALIGGQFDEAEIDGTFDKVIEASGALPAFALGIKALRRKGVLSILSNLQVREATLPLHLVMLREIQIVGSFQFNAEFEEAVQLVEAGAIDFEALTGARFPLSETGEALATMARGEAFGKIVIEG
ncbi:alcohol dehydrogenase catalytic domain-containing protein [Jannaschia sp. M317]|uniref:alcohol dehydrogenase catalytic domain-containing protein n=1 Tax=Jannaschia sp. M317 TaxID=2867011 RepID=UPI0021A2C0B7|nr:alcohol dehydrogenase catalytic domain-containing protein [Jannaschia sp. M317]UWQ19897.1 alcohol dehydrogenase catalytic domain-containing protein [Jannaschia sp. M317]